MKSKLGYLTNISLKRKIKTKWFLGANILLLIVIVGIINIDSVINFFGGDFATKEKIYVVDNTGKSFDLFKTNIKEASEVFDAKGTFNVIKYDKDIASAKKMIEKNDKNMVLVFENDIKNTLQATLITDGYMDTFNTQLINSSISNTKISLAILSSSISPDEMAKIYSPIEAKRLYLDDSKNAKNEANESLMKTIFPIFILPFFMLTIFLVQMIGAEVNDEKTTRGMEIIISNVSPVTHFFSKVIAGNLFVMLQGLLLVVFGGIGLLIRNLTTTDSLISKLSGQLDINIMGFLHEGIGSQLGYFAIVTIILMLLTFLAYSLLAGVLAAMTTNIEDFQQLQTPIMIISLIGFYLAMSANLFEGSLFIRIVSYIPLISAVLSPSLLLLGQIGIIDVLISISLMIITIFLLIKYGLRIYKAGILNYSSSGLWKKMFKALKE
ncbi:MAG: ABC transporter permease [Bacilli bacterium]